MREILFRGKRANNGEWTEGYYVHTRRHHCIITGCIDDGYVVHGHYANDVAMEVVDPATVGQYTGLTDVNGKKIFEGDIVRDLSLYLTHKYYFELGYKGEENYERYREAGQKALVEFNTTDVGSCGCCYDAFEGSGFIAFGVKIAYCEVIGNIHDNPEILEQEARNG